MENHHFFLGGGVNQLQICLNGRFQLQTVTLPEGIYFSDAYDTFRQEANDESCITHPEIHDFFEI